MQHTWIKPLFASICLFLSSGPASWANDQFDWQPAFSKEIKFEGAFKTVSQGRPVSFLLGKDSGGLSGRINLLGQTHALNAVLDGQALRLSFQDGVQRYEFRLALGPDNAYSAKFPWDADPVGVSHSALPPFAGLFTTPVAQIEVVHSEGDGHLAIVTYDSFAGTDRAGLVTPAVVRGLELDIRGLGLIHRGNGPSDYIAEILGPPGGPPVVVHRAIWQPGFDPELVLAAAREWDTLRETDTFASLTEFSTALSERVSTRGNPPTTLPALINLAERTAFATAATSKDKLLWFLDQTNTSPWAELDDGRRDRRMQAADALIAQAGTLTELLDLAQRNDFLLTQARSRIEARVLQADEAEQRRFLQVYTSTAKAAEVDLALSDGSLAELLRIALTYPETPGAEHAAHQAISRVLSDNDLNGMRAFAATLPNHPQSETFRNMYVSAQTLTDLLAMATAPDTESSIERVVNAALASRLLTEGSQQDRETFLRRFPKHPRAVALEWVLLRESNAPPEAIFRFAKENVGTDLGESAVRSLTETLLSDPENALMADVLLAFPDNPRSSELRTALLERADIEELIALAQDMRRPSIAEAAQTRLMRERWSADAQTILRSVRFKNPGTPASLAIAYALAKTQPDGLDVFINIATHYPGSAAAELAIDAAFERAEEAGPEVQRHVLIEFAQLPSVLPYAQTYFAVASLAELMDVWEATTDSVYEDVLAEKAAEKAIADAPVKHKKRFLDSAPKHPKAPEVALAIAENTVTGYAEVYTAYRGSEASEKALTYALELYRAKPDTKTAFEIVQRFSDTAATTPLVREVLPSLSFGELLDLGSQTRDERLLREINMHAVDRLSRSKLSQDELANFVRQDRYNPVWRIYVERFIGYRAHYDQILNIYKLTRHASIRQTINKNIKRFDDYLEWIKLMPQSDRTDAVAWEAWQRLKFESPADRHTGANLLFSLFDERTLKKRVFVGIAYVTPDPEEMRRFRTGLSQNEERALNKRAQSALIRMGCLSASADGVIGAQSMSALRRYESLRPRYVSNGNEQLHWMHGKLPSPDYVRALEHDTLARCR